MNVAVIGTGYVGLVSGACLAELGHQIICLDVDQTKIEKLRVGIMPIHEPGLEELVKRNVAAGRLIFTSSYAEAISSAEIISVAVGTPSAEDGSVDMQYVQAAYRSIAQQLTGYVVIANKSTVPVGTAEEGVKIVRSLYSGEFDVVSNPEFLREGHVVNDFLQPARIVIGTSHQRAADQMLKLYGVINCQKFVMSARSAELTKYAANAFLATKISFINEIAHLAEEVGADVEEIAKGMGSDPRIGKDFLRAGPGWGGSCFPKDVRALCHLAARYEHPIPVISAAVHMNQRARTRVVDRVEQALGGLKDKTISFLGLAFKNNTDDTRESPALDLIRHFLERGAEVVAYDAIARIHDQTLQQAFRRVDEPYTVAIDADALIIATESDEFCDLDFMRLKQAMRGDVLMDARNMMDAELVQQAGFRYLRVGRRG